MAVEKQPISLTTLVVLVLVVLAGFIIAERNCNKRGGTLMRSGWGGYQCAQPVPPPTPAPVSPAPSPGR